MKINSFKYLIKQGVSGIKNNLFMSFASFCIMLVSLLMVGLSVLLTINVSRIISSIEDKNEVVIVVKDNLKDEDLTLLGKKIGSTNNVKTVVFFSKDEAWKEMVESMPPEQKELFDYADSNPLPHTYRVRIDDIAKLTQTANEISTYDGIESVKVPNDFADILVNLRSIATVISTILLVSLVIVCVVIISNSIRSSVFARRKEINIMKYVGATNTFIRIPFFIEGLLLGLISSSIALLVTKYVYETLYETLTSNYTMNSLFGTGSMLPFNKIFVSVAFAYIASGVLLGVFGTVTSTRKHLKV